MTHEDELIHELKQMRRVHCLVLGAILLAIGFATTPFGATKVGSVVGLIALYSGIVLIIVTLITFLIAFVAFSNMKFPQPPMPSSYSDGTQDTKPDVE